MIKWGRKKTIQSTSSSNSLTSNESLKKWSLRFKKMKDGAKPKSEDACFDDWSERWSGNEENLYNSDYKLNVSPTSSPSFKKIVSNGRTMREFINEEQKSREVEIVVENISEVRIQKTDYLKENPTRRMKVDSSLENEWQNLKNMKINEIMLKNIEKDRKCVDVISKEEAYTRKRSKHGRKVNGHSPRIKPLEDMKKTRIRMDKEIATKDAFRSYFDSFAIIKSSYDPQQDFRNSMIEMIIENGIRRREELEELLACYLTLNCEKYHYLIVKVFQEVWFELSKVNFDPYFMF